MCNLTKYLKTLGAGEGLKTKVVTRLAMLGLQGNTASMLSLPDDCLLRIFSWVDDPRSFYNISLTCQRFSQVSKITKSELHTNLLRKKAEYFSECYMDKVADLANSDANFNDYKYRLKDLLRTCMHLEAAKRFLNYDKALDVWQNKIQH